MKMTIDQSQVLKLRTFFLIFVIRKYLSSDANWTATYRQVKISLESVQFQPMRTRFGFKGPITGLSFDSMFNPISRTVL